MSTSGMGLKLAESRREVWTHLQISIGRLSVLKRILQLVHIRVLDRRAAHSTSDCNARPRHPTSDAAARVVAFLLKEAT